MTIIKANKTQKGGTHDKVMTPVNIAKYIINWLPLKENQSILDCCKGEGAFFDNFPSHTLNYWCEIDKEKDFFEENRHFDWIISNPPYSIFDAFIQHAFELSENVCFLCPLSKIVSSMGRIKIYKTFGGVPKMLIIPACKCGFPFGFPAVAIWFKKNYNLKTKIEVKL